MASKIQRGAFIVFEGVDRCGKTTQCQKLVQALQSEGQKAQLIRFPDRSTAIGSVISDYLEKKCELEDHAVHLLFTANRWELVPKMKELLMNGTTLIVDRYSFSGVAYSAAKKGMTLQWCRQPEIGLPKPDAILFLNLSNEEAAKRGAYGEERYEKTDFQKAVAENYTVLNDSWKTIDANKTIEDLHEELKVIVKDIIANTDSRLDELWTSEEPSLKRKCVNDVNHASDNQVNGNEQSQGDSASNQKEN